MQISCSTQISCSFSTGTTTNLFSCPPLMGFSPGLRQQVEPFKQHVYHRCQRTYRLHRHSARQGRRQKPSLCPAATPPPTPAGHLAPHLRQSTARLVKQLACRSAQRRQLPCSPKADETPTNTGCSTHLSAWTRARQPPHHPAQRAMAVCALACRNSAGVSLPSLLSLQERRAPVASTILGTNLNKRAADTHSCRFSHSPPSTLEPL